MSSLSLPNPCRLFPFSMQDSRSRLSFLVLENPFPYSLALHWLVFSASSRSQSVRILCRECKRLPVSQRRLTFPCLGANPSMADKRGDYCVIPFFRHILRNCLACDRVACTAPYPKRRDKSFSSILIPQERFCEMHGLAKYVLDRFRC